PRATAAVSAQDLTAAADRAVARRSPSCARPESPGSPGPAASPRACEPGLQRRPALSQPVRARIRQGRRRTAPWRTAQRKLACSCLSGCSGSRRGQMTSLYLAGTSNRLYHGKRAFWNVAAVRGPLLGGRKKLVDAVQLVFRAEINLDD